MDVFLHEPRMHTVDVDAADIELIARMLDRATYPSTGSTGESLIVPDGSVSFQPDFVLLDLQMPDPDGFALLVRLEALVDPSGFAPIVVLTAPAGVAQAVPSTPIHHPELLHSARDILRLRVHPGTETPGNP